MNNNYGNIRPADVEINDDIDLYFMFQKSYNDDISTSLKIENPSDFIEHVTLSNDNITKIKGNYTLKMNANFIDNYGYGIYNFFVTNKEYSNIIIQDCGQLEGLGYKGIIIDLNQLDDVTKSFFSISNSLVGYRIEYGNSIYKIITSNFKVEPVVNSSVQTDSNVQYRQNDNSSLLFITLNVSYTNNNENNEVFIGNPNDNISISNTNFTPKNIMVEVKEYNEETIVNLLGYNGIVKNYDNGLLSYFDKNNEIMLQLTEYTVKDDNNTDLRKIRIRNENIDTSETL